MLIRRLFPTPGALDGSEAIEDAYAQPGGRHVRANFITSLDGAVELQGRSRGLGGPADREVFIALRAASDAILVGAGTVRAENYGPVRLDEARQARRVRRGQPRLPRLAVVTNSGDIAPTCGVFKGDEDVVVLTTTAVAKHHALPDTADVVACGDGAVDLGTALDALAERGLERVLCEGGPTLFRSLLVESLVDELCLTLSPVVAGAGHRRLLGTEPLESAFPLELTELFTAEGMLLSRLATR